MPGATSMQHLAELMTSLPWWRLRPAPELLGWQPGEMDIRRTVVAARTEDGGVAVVYVPQDSNIDLRLDGVWQPARAIWFDPRTGARQVAATPAGADTWHLAVPGDSDWALVLESGDRP
jgi:hypothetical protein